MRRSLLVLVTLLVLASVAGAQQTHQTLPSANATFIPDLQNFLLNEDPKRFNEFFGGIYTISGGIHGTGAGLTKSPSSLIAYPGGYYITETGAINYQDNATCWVVATNTTTAPLTGNFNRISGTKYAVDCVTSTQPTQPANSVYLMKVVTAAGAVTTVTDLRQFTPFTTPGSLLLNTLTVNGAVNNVTLFTAKRFTDTSPTGNFETFKDAAAGTLWNVDITGKLTAGTIATANTGPHAIGGATLASVGTRFTGALAGAFQYGVSVDHTVSPAASAEAAMLIVSGTLNKASSGTHNMFNGARFLVPTIGAGASALTTSATVRIDGTPSVGTNKYGLYNVGNTRLDDGVGIGSGTTALGQGLIVGPVADKGAGSINVSSGYYVNGLFIFRGYLSGYGLANDGASPNTVIDVAAGTATSDDNTTLMPLGAYTKSMGAWAVGTGNGCLDTGSVAGLTWYHVYIIIRPDTAVVDVLCSASASSPTMPGSYTKKRRVGSLKTDGSGNIRAFRQKGDWVDWGTPTFTTDDAATGTSAVTAVLDVPTGLSVIGRMHAEYDNGSAALYISPLDIADMAPSLTGTPLGSILNNSGTTGHGGLAVVRTNTAAQFRYRTSANGHVRIATIGWIDARGKDD